MEARQAFGSIAAEPGVDGVGRAGREQAGAGDVGRAGAVGDLEERGSTLAQVGFGVVVTDGDELGTLLSGEGQGAEFGHGEAPGDDEGITIFPVYPAPPLCAKLFLQRPSAGFVD
jgi:hypothetical protein